MIYTDQLGYLTNYNKIAISTKACNFQVIRLTDQKSVLDGVANKAIYDSCAGEDVYRIDFSQIREEGEYYILAGNQEKSHTFSIRNDIYKRLQNDALKCLYYQRCGMELLEEHAGKFKHGICHTDEAIMVEDYINKVDNPKRYDMSGGWHDAGDYGRYVTAGSVAVAHLLYAYELYPDSFKSEINIPESGNGIPDVLNECLYELKWMLKMQTEDGGVYHKLTTFSHGPFIMPEDEKEQLLIYPVSSMAVADFAAVMALASRIYRAFVPEFADEAYKASKKAITWLNRFGYVGFANPEGSNTGAYDDDYDLDERMWAAAEIIRVDTINAAYHLKKLVALCEEDISLTDFGWTDVSGLAALSVLTDPKNSAGMLKDKFRKIVISRANALMKMTRESGYMLAMEEEDYVWGSNMVVENRAMLFTLAAKISMGSMVEIYTEAALEHIHYLLGRNPLDKCYVSGYGYNSLKYPHARAIASDGIEEVMPGWVAGGPFRNFCDAAALKKLAKDTAAMKCYIDDVGSYSTNEITIYWNTPLVFLCAAIDSVLI